MLLREIGALQSMTVLALEEGAVAETAPDKLRSELP